MHATKRFVVAFNCIFDIELSRWDEFLYVLRVEGDKFILKFGLEGCCLKLQPFSSGRGGGIRRRRDDCDELQNFQALRKMQRMWK
jgi:hypothetical protein